MSTRDTAIPGVLRSSTARVKAVGAHAIKRGLRILPVLRHAAQSVISPYVRHELPGWGRLARAGGIMNDSLWQNSTFCQTRGKVHGYLMRLDLRDWSDRQTFFLRRYYDLPSQELLRLALRPGDRFVDVGANIGMMSLVAARWIGSTGMIHAFEPNPLAFERLAEHVRMNQLANVVLYQAALSDQPGTLNLRVVGGHTGAGTLGEVREADRSAVSMELPVRVLRGDDVIEGSPAPTTLKIDVEGFELRVLRGFEALLRANRPMVLAETVAWYLRRAGAELSELYEFMQMLGYRPFAFPLVRHGLSHRIVLSAVDKSHAERFKNIVWIHPDSVHAARVLGRGVWDHLRSPKTAIHVAQQEGI